MSLPRRRASRAGPLETISRAGTSLSGRSSSRSLGLLESRSHGWPAVTSRWPPAKRRPNSDRIRGLYDTAPSFVPAPELSSRGFVSLPRYDVRAASGGGAIVHSEQIVDVLAFRSDWIKHTLRLNPDNLALISAVGDSMTPTIKEGDLLLLDLTAGHVQDNAIYALGVSGSLLVKRIQMLTSGGVRVISDNPAYPPEEIPARKAGELRFVGRVVWHGAPI